MDSSTSDIEILHGIKSNNEAAFELLFERYHRLMFLEAKNILESQDEAKDAVQAIFMYVWEKRSKLNIRDSFRNYLVQAVRYRCLEIIREHTRSKKREKLYQENLHLLFSDKISLEDKEFKEYLLRVVEKIPPASREAFKMSFWENKSVEEIAAKTGTAKSTVYNKISKAINMIKEQFKHLQ